MRDWIDRPGSPLHGLVALMYPQGSMAIGATIARASDREEYDIDVIVALLIARDSDPEVVLDALYHAIRGEPGSRYYDKTTRHTRCVCVTYEDGMHIDLTPAVLVTEREPRTQRDLPQQAGGPERCRSSGCSPIRGGSPSGSRR